MKPLYEIASDFRKLLDSGLELEDPEAFNDTLESVELVYEEKALNVSRYFLNLEAEAEAIKEAEKRMAERRKSIEKHIARLKDYLKRTMEFTGVEEIKCPEFLVRIRKNPQAVIVDEPGLVPTQFLTATLKLPLTYVPENLQQYVKDRTPDKKAIKEELKSNGGADSPWAHLEQGTRLEIK